MMKKLLLFLLLLPGAAFAQNGITLPAGSNTLKALHFTGYPGLGIYMNTPGAMWIGDQVGGVLCTTGAGCAISGTVALNIDASASGSLSFEGTTADGNETTLTVTDPTGDNTITLPNMTGTVVVSSTANEVGAANTLTIASGTIMFEGATADASETTLRVIDPTSDRAVYLGDESGYLAVNPLITADATIQFGSTVMPDAGTDGRFDVTTGSATLSIGVYGEPDMVGPTAQGTAYPVVLHGIAYVLPAEDQTVTRGHYLIQSATGGRVSDSATVTTDGLNIALALYSEPVTGTINPAGCTGGAGCINTALNTPNAGPAGQITLGVDVAAAGWAVGDPVVYYNSGGATPTGLTDGDVYWLKSVSTTNVTIAATKTGAVVVPTTQGNDATQYLQRLPKAVVSIK